MVKKAGFGGTMMTIRTRAALLAISVSVLLLTSGCLYPKDQTPGNDASAREAVLTVQDAVDRYKESTGLLPIQNANASVPLYEKYRIDFGKLKRTGYVSSIPPAAFENGGNYVFLVIDEETKPQVKLLDLQVFQGINAVQKRVNEYRENRNGANPSGEQAYEGFRYVDFDKLGGSEPHLQSMYSRNPLELMVDDSGRVYADYGVDVAAALQKTGSSPAADEDLRRRLTNASYYVPVKAPEYRWAGDRPKAITQ